MALPQRVYDEDDSEPMTRPDLSIVKNSSNERHNPSHSSEYAASQNPNGMHAIQGGGQSTPRSQNHLRSMDNPDTSNPKSLSSEDLNKAENESGDESGDNSELDELDAAGFYKGSSKSEDSLEVQTKRKKKKLLMGGGGILGGLIGGAFLVMIPAMKVEIFMSQINQRAFGVVENAVEHRVQKHLETYIKKKIIPGLKGTCGPVVSSSCSVTSGNSIAGNLYEGWSQNRIEETILERSGIKIESNLNATSNSDRFSITKDGAKMTFGEEALAEGSIFEGEAAGRNVIGKELRSTLRKDTKWYEIMQRRSIDKYLKKHKLGRCLIACEARDKVEAKVGATAKARLRSKIIEKVVYPASSKYGIYMQCILEGCKNTAEDLAKLRNSAVDDLGEDAAKAILKEFEDKPGKKLSEIIVKNAVEKVVTKLISTEAGSAAGEAAGSAVPIAGQIYLGFLILDTGNEVWHGLKDNTLGKYASDLNAEEYLRYYSLLRSHNDELKSGKLNFGQVGALVGEFDGAGESQVFQALHSPTQTASLLGSRVYAEGDPAKSPYKCADDKGVPAGEYVCKEKKIVKSFAIEDWADNPTVAALGNGVFYQYEAGCDDTNRNDFPPTCLREFIHPTLKGINSALGAVTEFAFNGVKDNLEKTPYFGDKFKELEKTAQDEAGKVLDMVFQKIFPLPITPDSPGRDKYDGVVAGSEFMASEFAKGGKGDDGKSFGLGGVTLNDKQTAAILQDEQNQQDYEKSKESTIARLTDFSDPESIASRAIIQAPDGPSQFATAMVGNFSKILNGSFFASLASSSFGKAKAADRYDLRVKSPFGTKKVGFALDDPALKVDPDTLTPERCAKYEADREASKYIDDSGFDQYKVSNPCMLDEVAATAAGGLFTKAFDESGSSGSSTTSTSTSGSTIDPNLPSGTKEELIAKIKSSGKVTNANMLTTALHQTTLQVLLKLTEKYSFTLWQGAHRNNEAVDLGNINGKGVPTGNDYAATNEDASNFIRDVVTLIPQGNTWVGVSNEHFVSIGNEILKPKGGSVNLDLPSTTGASGAHFHIATPTGLP